MKEIDELLEKEQTEDAEYMIMKLLKRIEATREYPYCSIPVINVILTEKQKECEENGIELKMDINLQEELRMKQTDLCSAFANILDNAVRSCKQLTEHGVDQVTCIKLKVGMNRNYLIIRCENSYKKEFGKFREGSGLGLKILRDIARCYDGDLKMEQKEEVFVSQLSLKNHS